MTPLDTWLCSILAGHRAWTEATRAALRSHGLPTDDIDATLLEIAAVEREIAGEALPPRAGLDRDDTNAQLE